MRKNIPELKLTHESKAKLGQLGSIKLLKLQCFLKTFYYNLQKLYSLSKVRARAFLSKNLGLKRFIEQNKISTLSSV
jgi:hypothetical protein